jgi:uncharacterized membrane protein YdjX (TVP38/TMEM64 family)
MSERETSASLRRKLYLLVVALLLLLGLALAWSSTPMRAWLDVDRAVESLRRFGQAFGPLAAVGGFALALTLAVPLVFLTLIALVAYGPMVGFGCAMGGALLAAAASYGVGRFLGREVVQRLGGERINRLSQRLASRGLLAVVAARLLPVAPFAVVNMVAGASHIRLRDLMLGTLIGISPGTLAMTLFVDQITAALQHPTLLTLVLAGLTMVLIVLGLWAMQRWLRTHDRP